MMLLFTLCLFVLMCLSGTAIILLMKEMVLALIGLLITLLGVAGLMVLALADFNAVVQLMVYVGGILILLIFGYMMGNRDLKTAQITLNSFNRVSGLLAAASLIVILSYVILNTTFLELPHFFNAEQNTQAKSSISGIGISIFTKFLVPFEIAGLLLLLAFVYAASLAKDQKEN